MKPSTGIGFIGRFPWTQKTYRTSGSISIYRLIDHRFSSNVVHKDSYKISIYDFKYGSINNINEANLSWQTNISLKKEKYFRKFSSHSAFIRDYRLRINSKGLFQHSGKKFTFIISFGINWATKISSLASILIISVTVIPEFAVQNYKPPWHVETEHVKNN